MKYSTWKHLQNLYEAKGNEAGKLVQKLLAYNLMEKNGARKLSDHAIQGVDILFELGECSWAMEVKIVINKKKNKMTVGSKDFSGLNGQISKGCKARFAVLGNQLTDEWLFIPHPGSGFQSGKSTPVVLLRPFRDEDFLGGDYEGSVAPPPSPAFPPDGDYMSIAEKINETFEEVVEENIQLALNEGQEGLNKLLQSHPEYLLP